MAELKKSLGMGTIIALAITSVMGTGIFFGTAIGAKVAGRVSILAWLLLSLISVYVASIFGELVSMFPNAGGVYEFAKKTYGRFFSFMVGWVTWLVASITTSLMIVAMMRYLKPTLESFLALIGRTGHIAFFTGTTFQICLSIAIVIILNIIAAKGIEASSKTLIFFAGITLLITGTVVAFALPHVDISNIWPVIGTGEQAAGAGEGSGGAFLTTAALVLMTLFFIFESFFGWESASFMGEETKDPQRAIPRGVLIATIITSILGMLIAISFLGVFGSEELAGMKQPFINMAGFLFGERAGYIISFGVMVTLIGCAAGGIVSAPRLIMALARDKLFIDRLASVNPKTHTPVNAIIFQTAVTILVIIAGFAMYEKVLSMLIPLGIFMYVSVILTVPILRYRLPNHERRFRVAFGKTLPVLVALVFILTLAAWLVLTDSAWETFGLILSFVFFGVPIYLLLMFHYDPDVIVKLNDVFAYFTRAFERVLIPKKIDRSIFNHLEDIEGKMVLEFGCGVGTLTRELANKVGSDGQVIATDVSASQVRIAQARIWKMGINNVLFIHDIHQVNRVHTAIKRVDAIISVGMLGYIQDIRKVLFEMNDILPNYGKIFFVDYVDLFGIIPNVSWLSDEKKLKEFFEDCGFSVKIEKIRGKFWNYIYIYGFKSEEGVPFV